MVNRNIWTNGSCKIEWINEDQVKISNQFDKYIIMDGGDFESILNALISIKHIKQI